MATETVTQDVGKYADGESGAVAGLAPLDRVNRVHYMLDGIAALQDVFEVAIAAGAQDADKQMTDLIWSPAFNLVRMATKDIHAEVSAIHDHYKTPAAGAA